MQATTGNQSPFETMSFSITQMPSQENGGLAVVSATLSNGTMTRTDFGTAMGNNTDGRTNHEETINRARQQARERILQVCATQQQTMPLPTSSQENHSVQKNVGGGSKPASDKQKKVIIDKCAKNGLNPEDISRKICQRSFEELQGQDAHKLMQHLK